MPRIAVIDKELCTPKKCGHECSKFCPVNRKGEECIKIFEKSHIDEVLCIGCGICQNKCPFGAITIVNLPESLKESPIHRFGENEFALFRLPIPMKGIVGLLGPNGVGKTTALKILSGQLTPNLGNIEGFALHKKIEKTDWGEIIKLHRGTELQDYLERLSRNEITAVYKPQNISALAKLDNCLKDALESDELIKKLELGNCLDRKLAELSGGELQRTAIGIALSRDVDFYYIDEPSSFLDVKQRLNVARLLHEIAEKKYVVVVEHDLATLGFLADRIHIFYGEPSVYGIVSKPYSARSGINIFLGGYIKEDNVRIRDPIIFEPATFDEKKKKNILVQFENIAKKYNGFSLSVERGEIYQNEVLGVFGSNALGKTTFAKILAGIESYEGTISRAVKISYKPQYIESDFDGTVNELLASEKNTESSEFKMLEMHLGIERLREKIVKNLSGGELQRISIALCLAKECDLFLLDEPCAYLDVDQRLAAAKAIRTAADGKAALVIDHDLMFLNHIADRAMLFSGVSGKNGSAETISLKNGFNKFLKETQMTFRRDNETKRMRANKLGSTKDRDQKEKGEYYL